MGKTKLIFRVLAVVCTIAMLCTTVAFADFTLPQNYYNDYVTKAGSPDKVNTPAEGAITTKSLKLNGTDIKDGTSEAAPAMFKFTPGDELTIELDATKSVSRASYLPFIVLPADKWAAYKEGKVEDGALKDDADVFLFDDDGLAEDTIIALKKSIPQYSDKNCNFTESFGSDVTSKFEEGKTYVAVYYCYGTEGQQSEIAAYHGINGGTVYEKYFRLPGYEASTVYSDDGEVHAWGDHSGKQIEVAVSDARAPLGIANTGVNEIKPQMWSANKTATFPALGGTGGVAAFNNSLGDLELGGVYIAGQLNEANAVYTADTGKLESLKTLYSSLGTPMYRFRANAEGTIYILLTATAYKGVGVSEGSTDLPLGFKVIGNSDAGETNKYNQKIRVVTTQSGTQRWNFVIGKHFAAGEWVEVPHPGAENSIKSATADDAITFIRWGEEPSYDLASVTANGENVAYTSRVWNNTGNVTEANKTEHIQRSAWKYIETYDIDAGESVELNITPAESTAKVGLYTFDESTETYTPLYADAAGAASYTVDLSSADIGDTTKIYVRTVSAISDKYNTGASGTLGYYGVEHVINVTRKNHVVFKDSDEYVLSDAYYNTGDPIEVPTPRLGTVTYVFKGWFVEGDTDENIVTPGTALTDVVYKAKYEKVTAKVGMNLTYSTGYFGTTLGGDRNLQTGVYGVPALTDVDAGLDPLDDEHDTELLVPYGVETVSFTPEVADADAEITGVTLAGANIAPVGGAYKVDLVKYVPDGVQIAFTVHNNKSGATGVHKFLVKWADTKAGDRQVSDLVINGDSANGRYLNNLLYDNNGNGTQMYYIAQVGKVDPAVHTGEANIGNWIWNSWGTKGAQPAKGAAPGIHTYSLEGDVSKGSYQLFTNPEAFAGASYIAHGWMWNKATSGQGKDNKLTSWLDVAGDYNGQNGNPYFMTFKVSDPCTVVYGLQPYKTNMKAVYGPSSNLTALEADGWTETGSRFLTNNAGNLGSISLGNTSNGCERQTWVKSFNAGDTVCIPSFDVISQEVYDSIEAGYNQGSTIYICWEGNPTKPPVCKDETLAIKSLTYSTSVKNYFYAETRTDKVLDLSAVETTLTGFGGEHEVEVPQGTGYLALRSVAVADGSTAVVTKVSGNPTKVTDGNGVEKYDVQDKFPVTVTYTVTNAGGKTNTYAIKFVEAEPEGAYIYNYDSPYGIVKSGEKYTRITAVQQLAAGGAVKTVKTHTNDGSGSYIFDKTDGSNVNKLPSFATGDAYILSVHRMQPGASTSGFDSQTWYSKSSTYQDYFTFNVSDNARIIYVNRDYFAFNKKAKVNGEEVGFLTWNELYRLNGSATDYYPMLYFDVEAGDEVKLPNRAVDDDINEYFAKIADINNGTNPGSYVLGDKSGAGDYTEAKVFSFGDHDYLFGTIERTYNGHTYTLLCATENCHKAKITATTNDLWYNNAGTADAPAWRTGSSDGNQAYFNNNNQGFYMIVFGDFEPAPVPVDTKITVIADSPNPADKAWGEFNGTDISETNIPYGAEVTLKAEASDDRKFNQWVRVDEKGHEYFLSYEPEYTITATATDVTYKAKFDDKLVEVDQFDVTMLGRNGETILSGIVTGATTDFGGEFQSADDLPYVIGYTFNGWDVKNNDEFEESTIGAFGPWQYTDFLEGGHISGDRLVYRTRYEWNRQKDYTVTFVNVKTLNGSEAFEHEYPVAFNTKLTVTPIEDPSGKVFQYWTKNGAIVSYAEEYTMYAPAQDVILEAVFGDVAPAAQSTVTIGASSESGATPAILFNSERNIVEGYTVVESGILLGTDSKGTGDNLSMTENYAKVMSNFTTNKGNVTVRVKLTPERLAESNDWYGRGYVIYKNATGKLFTKYSDVLKVNYDSGIFAIGE